MGQPQKTIGYTEVMEMARDIKIRTVSYVRVNGELVEFEKLTPEQKRKAATILKVNYLNALFAGKAEFRAAEQ